MRYIILAIFALFLVGCDFRTPECKAYSVLDWEYVSMPEVDRAQIRTYHAEMLTQCTESTLERERGPAITWWRVFIVIGLIAAFASIYFSIFRPDHKL